MGFPIVRRGEGTHTKKYFGAFLNCFARKKNESDEAKNEFFNSFINRVILYDDRVLIFYNTDPTSPTTIDTTENKTICDQFNQNNAKENSLEPSGFKRVSLGGTGVCDYELYRYLAEPKCVFAFAL